MTPRETEPLCRIPSVMALGTDTFPLHYHTAIEITGVVSGRLEVQLAEGSTVLKPGDLLFAAPEMLHGYRIFPEEPQSAQPSGSGIPGPELFPVLHGGMTLCGGMRVRRPITFKAMLHPDCLGGAAELVKASVGTRPVLRREILETEFPDCWQRIYDISYPHLPRDMIGDVPENMRNPLFEAFALQRLVLKLFPLTNPKREKRGDRTVFSEIVRLLCEHCTEEGFTAETVGDVLGIRAQRVRDLCRSNMNIGFRQYLSVLRLDRAAALLLSDPSRNVTEIAMSCGYSSASSFNRAFAEKYGVSPTYYRQTGGQILDIDGKEVPG